MSNVAEDAYENPSRRSVARMLLYSLRENGRMIVPPHFLEAARRYGLVDDRNQADMEAIYAAAEGA